MTVYLGSLGRMVPIYSTPSASVVAEERYSFSTTLEGRRKAQVRPVGRRTWSWSSGFADAKESAVLVQFAQGAWGPGPFVFVSADAPFTNMLSPAVASCDSAENPSGLVVDGGPVQGPGGVWYPRSYLNPDGVTIFFGASYGSGAVPVIAGSAVTGSALVFGAGSRALLSFFDAAGATLSSHFSTVLGSASGPVRSWVSVVAPVGAVAARVFASSASRATAPAITWSDGLLEWSDGQGCAKAVLHGATRDLSFTSRHSTYSNLGFTVSEVG